MKLYDLEKGDRAVVKRMDTSLSLKNRLASLGVVRGSEISVEGCSLGKGTIEIMADETLIGIRGDEAKQIEVERV
jgi:Fe2+ transport system protein FeoA